jgi:hypothetical protein
MSHVSLAVNSRERIEPVRSHTQILVKFTGEVQVATET